MNQIPQEGGAGFAVGSVKLNVPPPNPFFKPPAPEGPRIQFPLPNDNAIEIRLKKPVSKKDFDRIIKLVELSEDSLVGDAE